MRGLDLRPGICSQVLSAPGIPEQGWPSVPGSRQTGAASRSQAADSRPLWQGEEVLARALTACQMGLLWGAAARSVSWASSCFAGSQEQ